MRRIHIDGQPVADIEVERPYGQRGVDHLFLHRSPAGWTLLTVSSVLRYDDEGAPAAGDGWVNLERLSTGDLATTMTHRYGRIGWHHLLDTAHGDDTELHELWAPTQLERDLDSASLHCQDLARYSALLDGHPLPAAGRQHPEWRDEALARMGAHLQARGVTVGDLVTADALGANGDWDPDRTVGALTVRCYGVEATTIIQVDDAGELYARIYEPNGEIDQPAVPDPAPLAPPRPAVSADLDLD